MTINPHVDAFLTIYSQSERSTGGTRGYDPETYVETKLDHNLIPRILDAKTKLVVLTGNAGDGKTTFIQHPEDRHRPEPRCRNAPTAPRSRSMASHTRPFTMAVRLEGSANDAVLAGLQVEEKAPRGESPRSLPSTRESPDFILNNPSTVGSANRSTTT